MKIPLQLILSGILAISACAEFRTWTRNDGKTAELDLISVTGEADAKTGQFKMRSGKSVVIAAGTLNAVDAVLLNQWVPAAPAATTATASAEGKPSVFDEVLSGNLEILDGKSLKRYDMVTKPTKHYVFYYTASWCGPCQAFTPELVDFYNRLKKDNNSFELVLISSDKEQADMEEYAKEKKMPWPQLKLSKIDAFSGKFDHEVSGIPAVIVCDLKGTVLSRTRDLDEVKKILK